MVFKKKIEPFTKSSDNDLKMKENEEILKPYPLEKKTSIEIALILKKHNITNFVDPDYYPILKEVEVDAREYFSL